MEELKVNPTVIELAPILDGKKKASKYTTCVEVFNDCPSSWKVTIIEIGSKFWYQNAAGQSIYEEIVSKTVNIPSYGSDQYCGTYDGCCHIIYTAIKADVDGSIEVFTDQTQVGPEECIVYNPLSLGPQRQRRHTSTEAPLVLRKRP